MNILTIGLGDEESGLLDTLVSCTGLHQIRHIWKHNQAVNLIRDTRLRWDWIVIQGHDQKDYWKSVLCAIHATASQTPVTVLSSHLDGSRLETPVCSMHKDEKGIRVSRCAMQNLLNGNAEKVYPDQRDAPHLPVVFEYHAPCK